jgi:hypothetical protein
VTLVRRAAISVALAAALVSVLLPGVVLGVEPTFGPPTATTTLGERISFSTTISGDDVAAAEVLFRLAGHPTTIVLAAEAGGTANTWQVTQAIDIGSSALCACLAEGNSAPNTRFDFQFRARARDGTTTLGPVGHGIVTDDRFEWRTIEQGLVRVHWYAGDDTFAQRAADLANEAIDRASELLGTTLPEAVDLFVYDTQQALLEAVSPNRENIAGEAHQAIDTMFVWIPSDQGADAFAGEVVRHELTHLVFDEATLNDYHQPALWINEGVAVYLSVGYTPYYESFVDGAVADRSLIPLDGLIGLFPSSQDQFYLAYGEAVAGIDFFIRTYGEPKLWDLVRSYASGLTDDQAFSDATGADVGAFNAAWFASLGEEVPAPLGPQPGPTGALPPGWQAGGQTPGATVGPAQTPQTPNPTVTAQPGQPGGESDGLARTVGIVLWLVAIGAIVALIGFLLVERNRARRPPQGW